MPLLKEPEEYLVSIRSENYVAWEFCMRVLVSVFHKTSQEAHTITDTIQNGDEGYCGMYNYEIAETKAAIVETLTKKEGFSVACFIERVENP